MLPEDSSKGAVRMFTKGIAVEFAKKQPGYLGHESARDGLGITVSYWESLDAIRNWKMVSEHLFAQRMGREKWYSSYKTRICLVERDYGFELEN